MTKIGKNATAAKFSAEGQALEYEGTIYIPDGGDNVYAMDASTGEILWTYEPHLPPDPLGEVVCCGWDNRGVAIGDGMVFVSQLNGDEVALDQMTGKVKWSTNIEKSNKRLLDHQRPALLQRPCLRRRFRRRVRRPRSPDRPRRQDRQDGLALLDHPGAERNWWQHLAEQRLLQGRRRFALEHAFGRPRTGDDLLLDLERVAVARRLSARAKTCSPPRSSR